MGKVVADFSFYIGSYPHEFNTRSDFHKSATVQLQHAKIGEFFTVFELEIAKPEEIGNYQPMFEHRTYPLVWCLFVALTAPVLATGAQAADPAIVTGDIQNEPPSGALNPSIADENTGGMVTCDLAELVVAQDNYYDGLRLTNDCLSQELPDERRARFLGIRGKILFDIGRNDEASADFEEAISLGGSTANLFHGRGLCALARGATEEAIADFQKVMSLEPKSPIGATAMGRAYFAKGDIEDAVTFLDFALSRDADYSPALLLRSEVLYDVGGYGRVIETLNKLLANEPDHHVAAHLRGNAYLKLGDFENALLDLQHASAIRPKDDEILTDRSLALIGLRKLRDATRTLDLAVELRPGNSRAFYIRGSLKLAQGKTEAGRDDLKHAITMDPEAEFVEDALLLLQPADDG